MVPMKIDNREVEASEGSTVLEAASSIGVEIPTLCHHEAILPYGACRLCMVEVSSGGRERLVPSCIFRVEPGIEVVTDSATLRAGRRMILELLLAECPEVKAIRKRAEEAGIERPRFPSRHGDCILCGLCVRVCEEVVGASVIGYEGRGASRKVTTPFGSPSEDCKACGACSFVCPTGAIKMEVETMKRLIKLDGIERPCRYMLMGMVPYKICPNAYRCHLCEVDQEYEDTFGTHPTIGLRLGEAG